MLRGFENRTINKSVNRQMTGSFANHLLSDTISKIMLIELVYAASYEPKQTTINNLFTFLKHRTFKPNGIILEKRIIASPEKKPIPLNKLKKGKLHTNDQIAFWALFIDGQSKNDSKNS